MRRRDARDRDRPEGIAKARAEHASSGNELQAILRLQRSIGNRATARLMRQATAKPAASVQQRLSPGGSDRGPSGHLMPQKAKGAVAPKVGAQEAKVESWDIEVTPGGQGANIRRGRDFFGTRTVFVGDTVIIRAHMKKLGRYELQEVTTPWDDTDLRSFVVLQQQWENRTTFKWVLKATGVGRGDVKTAMTDQPDRELGEPVGSFGEYEGTFRIVADFDDFLAACGQAQSSLSGKFLHATKRMDEATKAFRQAVAAQQADLDEVARRQKMFDDLLFGAIFAAAGGFVGGWLGGWLKQVKNKAYAKDDWLIDTAKDTVKYAVRTGDKLRTGGVAPVTKGSSTAPSVTGTGETHGEHKASGQDPMDFLTDLGARIADEGDHAQDALTKLISEARKERSFSSRLYFDEDPVAIVTKDLTLDRISAELPVDTRVYLKGLWKTWLEAYGARKYKTGELFAVVPAVQEKIQHAAAALGETAEQWGRQWADPKNAWNAQKQEKLEEEMEKQGGYLTGP